MSQAQSQATLPFDADAGAAGAALHLLTSRALPAEPGVRDELREPGGALRPAWQRFAQRLPAPPADIGGAADLDRRVAQVAQRIRQDGVTHNVFGADGSGAQARPWSLELLPLLIEAGAWAQIEAGAVQRAELLQRMLADLYGPQLLLREGLLPPASRATSKATMNRRGSTAAAGG